MACARLTALRILSMPNSTSGIEHVNEEWELTFIYQSDHDREDTSIDMRLSNGFSL